MQYSCNRISLNLHYNFVGRLFENVGKFLQFAGQLLKMYEQFFKTGAKSHQRPTLNQTSKTIQNVDYGLMDVVGKVPPFVESRFILYEYLKKCVWVCLYSLVICNDTK